jgi:hypothetical protein
MASAYEPWGGADPLFCEVQIGAPRHLSGTRGEILDALRREIEAQSDQG